MKPKEIEALESYFKTDNEHWNGYTFKMVCEVLQQGNFDNPELPLQLFSNACDIFVGKHKTPLQAVEQFAAELDKNKLIASQKLFIYEEICRYLENTEYKDLDLTPIKDLVESKKEQLAKEVAPKKPLIKDFRESLKTTLQKEMELLPETLSKLEATQRLNILCKLMPYVFPKVDSVNSSHGEPHSFDF